MVTARTAILQALRQGPGYGRLLMRRVTTATGGRASLAPGSTYPTLKALEKARLVRKWTVIAGRARGGRARTYYELSVAGIREAEAEAAALAGITLGGRPPLQVSASERSALRARAERVAALFAFSSEARDSLARARRRVSASRRRRPDLASAAVRLARLLGPDECVLVGGLAVGVHGHVRATDDLDFISRPSLAVTRKRLRKAGLETRLLRGDVLDGGFRCLKGEIDGIPFDVLPPLVPIAWDRALPLDIGGGTLKVVDLDGLLQLKFRAGGSQDLLDAARLVMLHPETEARAQELATAYRARDRFDIWLRDPRIRAQAQEEARRERRAARPGSKRAGAKVPKATRKRRPSSR